MTLFIAWLIIYGLQLDMSLYLIAFVAWLLHIAAYNFGR